MGADLRWFPYLLQTADALFPTGAYAHSFGFEEAVRLGMVTHADSLHEFLRLQIAPALENQELPYLHFSHAAAADESLDELCSIDGEVSAWKLSKEARQASAQIGVRRLKALRVICPESSLLAEFETRIETGVAAGHHLVVCALQGAIERAPLRAVLLAYAYQAFAAICAAAMKLIRIGQDGCQRVLRSVCLDLEDIVERSLVISRADAGWFNPLLEIASMRHARADERLFIS